ncbi:S-adenosylmethionine:tRNA ribosyltransferase-isomerase [Rhodococcus sp. JS3073]|uniref:S-adenosylmethionine:tRNA ribosyltransferase-isomerase n=1 Tax=Rhodococcus sp. JS3073 TaxID=3002901 RepID=UPI00228588E0|nr:S-adenosylmethionine:tRNA ribosyltransferase-isomerase [Rhodococcus sp. JS3073]WAM15093.1 S-adenosylmethionine:tRNA ribosyltransferase-isomerase [Rhodococcus sp. JS3073]
MTGARVASAAEFRFVLPRRLEASGPPESRGLLRDAVRLLVSDRGRVEHTRFHDLPRFLRPGDVVVVNASSTLAAAVDGTVDAVGPVVVHFSTDIGDGDWAVEVRAPGPVSGALDTVAAETRIILPRGVVATLMEPWPVGSTRLWRASIDGVKDVAAELLATSGRPITYAYVHDRWPLPSYQTIFGRTGGSAEMASAARPFTHPMVTDLATSGVVMAPILLHTGVSSPERGEPPIPERYEVPEQTAQLVNDRRAAGGRVIAVGTTVTRALETQATSDGMAVAGAGWTDLVLSAGRPTQVVDGLITGWHAPGASHLMLLESVVGEAAVRHAYDEALARGYLWHEFGDSALLLRR